MRIRAKLSLFTGLIVLFTTVSVAAIGYVLQKRLIERHMAESEARQSSAFASVCRQALTVNNELFMLNYVKLLQESPGISYAYFVDPTGKILVHSDSRLFYKTTDEWRRPPGTLEISVPVALGHSAAGNAVVGFSEEFHQARLKEALARTLRQVVLAAAVVAGLGLAAALLFAYVLTNPIKALMMGSEKIAKGDFKTEVLVTSQDELGELTARFNSMAKSLAILDELKDEFISNVSHDLRNPMAAIQMYADYLLNSDDDRDKLLPAHRNTIVTIMDNARRLGLFVTNMLDAAKIKAGRMEYHARPVAIDPIAQNVEKLFGIVARKRHINLTTEVPMDLPPLLADPERLEQVIANLISNALKFTNDGGKITLGAQRTAEGAEVFVADTGKGIPKEHLPALFGRFNQSDVADQRSKNIKGTGLGLYIVKKTVEDMGGAITVESEVGRGTRFTLSLPVASPQETGTKEMI